MTRFHMIRTLVVGVLLCAACAMTVHAASSDQPQGLAQAKSGETFTLNFKKADIKAFITTVSELTGRNFVLDPRVSGKVTVLSSHPMTPDELYETFLAVLDVHGFATIPMGAVTKIVPEVLAKQSGSHVDDTTTSEDLITRVIQVANVPAARLVPILRPLLPQGSHLAAYPASNSLIISDRRANVERIRRIVNRIDKKGNQRVEIIELEHAYAGEVVRIIRKLKSKAGGKKSATNNFSIIANERTNSVMISAGPTMRLRLRAIIADLDIPAENKGGTQVVYLDYADAEKVADILQKFVDNSAENSGKGSNSESQGISVIAAKGTNALVINAPSTEMQEIRQVVDKLDIRRGQVLIEGIIAEVSLVQNNNLGINVAVKVDEAGLAASVLDMDTADIISSIAGGSTPLKVVQESLQVVLAGSSGGNKFAAILQALATNARTNVLSTPSIVTQDNEEAKISVGQEVPFVTGQFTTGVNNGGNNGITNPFQTIERKNVGLSLNLTPQINAGNTVQLDLELEVSNIAQGASGNKPIITNKRTLETTVTVESGQILVLGGLIDSQVNESTQKVPILSDIPLIGALFTSHSSKRVKRNLLNFIHATILNSQDEANYYTRRKYQHIRHVQQSQPSDIPLMPEAKRPVLPPIERYMQTPVFPDGFNTKASQESVPTPQPQQDQR